MYSKRSLRPSSSQPNKHRQMVPFNFPKADIYERRADWWVGKMNLCLLSCFIISFSSRWGSKSESLMRGSTAQRFSRPICLDDQGWNRDHLNITFISENINITLRLITTSLHHHCYMCMFVFWMSSISHWAEECFDKRVDCSSSFIVKVLLLKTAPVYSL